MKQIPLSQGKFALVDDEDYEYLSQWKWSAHRHCNNVYYAVRSIYSHSKNSVQISMHRIIMNAGKGTQLDHIDGNGTNNQKSNLRFVTTRQNSHNRHPSIPKKSRYPGVFWRNDNMRWRAIISINGELEHLGQFNSEYEAYLAYKNKCNEIGEPICSF